MAEELELLALARRCATDREARWELAQHFKMRSIVEREIRRVAWDDCDLDDLRQAVTMAIAQAAIVDRDFEHEGQVVAYWNLRVRHHVTSAIQKLRPVATERDEDGWLVLREKPTEEWLLNILAGPAAEETEQDKLLAVAREVLFGHPDRVCADVFWHRCQGLNWRDVCQTVGVQNRATARALYWRFVADAKAVLTELGERVEMQIGGLFITEGGVSVVVVQNRRALSRWSIDYDDLADLGLVQERLEDECNRGVGAWVTNSLDGDIGTVIKLTLVRFGLQLEEFDFEALKDGVAPAVWERCPGSDEERWAYLMAVSKEAENELKGDRL